MDIRQATNALLSDPAVGQKLRLADSYIQAYNRVPDSFVLPSEHLVLKPVIEAFAKNTKAFAEYIRAMRDGFTGPEHDELHDLYRTVYVRSLQVERRQRMRKAVVTLLPKLEAAVGRTINYDEQTVLAKIIEQCWGAMRVDMMDRERKSLTTKRIPLEERSAMLDAFWTNIDKKLAKGEVLMHDETFAEMVEALNK